MSVLWMDDPSFYVSLGSGTGSRFPGIGVAATGGRFSNGPCWSPGNIGNVANLLPGSPNVVTGTIACSIFTASVDFGLNRGLLSLTDGATVQVDLRLDSGGHVFVTRNGTTIGSASTSAVTANAWHRLELQATIDPSNGAIEVHVDGVTFIARTTGLNTRATANSSFNSYGFGSGTGTLFNDLVVTDSNSPNAGFLGDKRCFLITPNGNSSVAWTPNFASFVNSHSYFVGDQFKDSNGNVQRCTINGTSQSTGTPTWATTGGSTTTSGTATFAVVGTGSNPGAQNWMAVAEIPSPDGDDSYNSDSTPGDIDLFTLTSLPAGAQNIAAVDPIVYARKDDAGTRTITNHIKSGTTVVDGPNIALSTTYQYIDNIQQTDPNTSAAWTVTGVNNLLVGYKEIA